ncbi:MAG: acyl-CoA dehydrogenase family protein [Deltaproteobacteria bacterium]|nr:acyl-CoA dehydrogenase family protein [Deltaproteobacteria bacterium]
MVDFSLNEKDQEIIQEIRKKGELLRKYARYYDEHEGEKIPDELSEAKDFDHIAFMNMERMNVEGATGPTTYGIFSTIHDSWGDPMMTLRLRQAGLGNASLAAAGTDDQQEKWMSKLLAMANTEPSCGSDSKAIETTAVKDGDDFILNGEKIFVTDGARCDGVVVWATLDKSKGRGAIKAFVVMKDTPGFEIAKKEEKMGIRASDTAAFIFKDCRVPKENLLGMDDAIKTGGGGFKGLMKTFNLTRPHVAAQGTGCVLGMHEFAVEELKKEGVEVDWEAGIHRQSAIQEKLIELESQLEAAALTTLRAAWLADVGKVNNLESAICKAKGGDVSRSGAQIAIEILGALGISHDYMVERWFRDARITDIYEGTGEINRLVTARAILNYSSADLM